MPEVLSQKEVERLLLAATTQRDRCLLMTAYATGLRVSELVRLKVSAIDSHRMMVRVEQGKGRKDRYTILSQRLLCELRSYWKEHRSPTYLFPNRKGTPISIDYAQKTYNRAKLRAGIEKGTGFIRSALFCYSSFGSRGGSENHSDAVGSYLFAQHRALFADPPAPDHHHGQSFRSTAATGLRRHSRGAVARAWASGRTEKGRPELADIFRQYGQSYRKDASIIGRSAKGHAGR